MSNFLRTAWHNTKRVIGTALVAIVISILALFMLVLGVIIIAVFAALAVPCLAFYHAHTFYTETKLKGNK